jgi:phage tail protein X
MSQIYRCKEGDMLDWICWKHYGRQSTAVEAVLEANPGLAEEGPMFSAGTLITLPDLEEPELDIVRIWK